MKTNISHFYIRIKLTYIQLWWSSFFRLYHIFMIISVSQEILRLNNFPQQIHFQAKEIRRHKMNNNILKLYWLSYLKPSNKLYWMFLTLPLMPTTSHIFLEGKNEFVYGMAFKGRKSILQAIKGLFFYYKISLGTER